MRHAIALDGYGYRLRPLQVDDAEFLLSLRLKDGIREHVNPTSHRVSDQRAWIEQRHRSETDYSFVLDNGRGTPTGSFSIYENDRANRRARIGRWLVQPGSRSVPEFALLGYFVCFAILELDSVYCRIPSDNVAALAFQKRIKAKGRGEASRVELNGRIVGLLEFESSSTDWPALFDTLQPLAMAACSRAPERGGPSNPVVSHVIHRSLDLVRGRFPGRNEVLLGGGPTIDPAWSSAGAARHADPTLMS